MSKTIAIIGFGEAGSVFAAAAGWEADACAYDVAPERASVMHDIGVACGADLRDTLASASLVLSLVTADAAADVARAAAPLLTDGALYCDMNSIAPQTKREAAAAVDATGGRYVDVAVMAPVEPGRLNVPLLLSGEAAADAATALSRAGFADIRIVGTEVGRASAIKMLRSVMVKGIEALTAEMMLAATRAGVVDDVLASLDASEKDWGWSKRAAYNLERMATHGLRRAAEMEESAKTLAALGVDPAMTSATVRRQREMAGAAPICDAQRSEPA
ncbi:DUF1932 domain-containing protein [Sphingopyxis indica]|uniref:NAD(P)-dependent oxidoreductase n=1 Tax=Sphingopyxis indica TaxID=436663 RepID=UPI002938FDA3|nr:DUF1932 domain-containing protein [Sphingopyxis indica]WOF42281.1 DUF1932 domain-containing protein [Sphingopyxis indica]